MRRRAVFYSRIVHDALVKDHALEAFLQLCDLLIPQAVRL